MNMNMNAPTNNAEAEGISRKNRRILSIPIHASNERRQNALLGQLEHHKNRRLARNEIRRQRGRQLRGDNNSNDNYNDNYNNNGNDDEQKHHPALWRQSYTTATVATRNDANNDPNNHRNLVGLITDVGLSNCHLVLYSGMITLGSPPLLQHFRVDFDTAGSDLWVPSKLCDGTCASAHPTWSYYDPSISSTYTVATEDLSKNEFALEYQDGEAIKGEHAKDTLRIGDDGIRISHQVFAHVTHIANFATCEEEEGILGLANAMTTTHGFPSFLGNILRHSTFDNGKNKVFPYNIFGMYLRADVDDYAGVDITNENEKPRASSELILGGVNQEHYLGCLNWHSLLKSSEDLSGTGEFSKYWSVRLDDVKVGGTSLTKSSSSAGELIAVLDSGSSYIVGPQGPVAHMVKLNQAKCFRMASSGEGGAADPKEVDCDDAGGFDGAVLNNCDDPFFSVEFVIEGRVYVLEKEDLMVHLDTLFGTVCILRVVASQSMNGWILGDAFLNKYYTAFDFENQRLGIAPAAEYADDRCERDLDMDVTYFWKNVYGEEDEDVFDPEDYQPDIPTNNLDPVEDTGNASDSDRNDNNAVDNVKESENDANSNNDIEVGIEQAVPQIGDEPAEVDATDDSLDDDFFKDQDESFEVNDPPPTSDALGDINNGGPGPTQEEVESWVDEVIDNAGGIPDDEAVSFPDEFPEGTNDADKGDASEPDDDAVNADQPSGGNPNDAFYEDDNFNVANFLDDTTLDDVFVDLPPASAPFHHEDPQAVDVPSIGGTSDALQQVSKAPHYGLTGTILVIAILVPMIAVLMHRRKRKPSSISKQQELFQKTYNRAEKKMLKEHRNLNYRNHHTPREMDAIDAALDELSYTNESFHDEEGGPDQSREEDGEDVEPEFVLDSDILRRMN